MLEMILPNGEIATDIVATAAVTSPLWLPTLQATSATFTELWPILGGVWLAIQIVRALITGWVAWRNWKPKTKPKTK